MGSFLLEIIVFSGILAILYFPLGIIFISNSLPKGSVAASIFLGLIYAFCAVSFVIVAVKAFGYQYWVFTSWFMLILCAIYVLLKYRAGKYTIENLKAQYVRIGMLILLNIMIWLKQVLR
jgi:hypothetical protein